MPKKNEGQPQPDAEIEALRQRADKITKSTEASVRRLKLLQAEIEERLKSQRLR